MLPGSLSRMKSDSSLNLHHDGIICITHKRLPNKIFTGMPIKTPAKKYISPVLKSSVKHDKINTSKI